MHEPAVFFIHFNVSPLIISTREYKQEKSINPNSANQENCPFFTCKCGGPIGGGIPPGGGIGGMFGSNGGRPKGGRGGGGGPRIIPKGGGGLMRGGGPLMTAFGGGAGPRNLSACC